MSTGAHNLLASVSTPPPPPKFHSTRISLLHCLNLHTRPCSTAIATKLPMVFPLKNPLRFRRVWVKTPSSPDPLLENDERQELSGVDGGGGGNGGGEGDGEGWGLTTSFLLFGLWAGLMYYVFILSPNQTPATDIYFLQKLLNLKGDDGFRMNEVLVALWYMMGLWPMVYSMLLIPTARTPKCSVPIWPFLVLSFFGGVYALFPFFILWKPPPPPVKETELKKWPLNFLESKLVPGIVLASGIALIVYAGISDGDVWKEFFQYFRQSKFIHIMSIDFTLLSAFAPFWVFNDMTTRKWYDKGSWLLPVSAIPLVGPAIYLFLRPPMPAVQVSSSPTSEEE